MNVLPIIEVGSMQAPVSFVRIVKDYEAANINQPFANQVNTVTESPDGQVFLMKTADEKWPQLKDLGERIADTVRREPGFAVVRGLNINDYEQRLRNALLLSFVSAVGTPTDHNNDKRVLWPVTPQEAVTSGRKKTFSEEAGEAPFHTDSAFIRSPERFLSLYVVREAQDGGGQSVLLSGKTVIRTLESTAEGRRCLRILREEEFPFRVPDAFFAGEDAIVAPIVAEEPLIRFRYDSIVTGFQLRPEMKTPEKVWAVDYFHQFMRSCNAGVTYKVGRGEMILFDNHSLLHSRTHFVDPQRLLIRVRMHQRAA